MKLKAWHPGVEPACLGRGTGVPYAKLLVQHGVCVGWLLLGRRRTIVVLRQKVHQERVMRGGSHHRVLKEVSQKDWPHSDTDHPGNGVEIPGPASRVSTVPTMPVFLGLDCRASQVGSQGAVVLTPIMRPAVRCPPA